MAALTAYHLGLMDYQQAFDLQDRLIQERIAGDIGTDILLLLEHPPTLTMGKRDDPKHLLVSESEISARGVAIVSTDRGGSITWHGPGQLVAYSIVDLKQRQMDVHKYIRNLETVIIRTLADFSIRSARDENHVGVWVEQDKIAAIGVRIRKWVTKHGFAINVNSDLTPFSLINPCGITDRGVTSIAAILGHDVSMEDVRKGVVKHFSDVFDMPVEIGSADQISTAK
ncbi:MAG: lipoyl(octanoyl) transferase LipB [Desulfobacterales bacterium]